MNLFGEDAEVIRTLGFYQPFCTAMLHDKVETRWIRKGRVPPMPLGKYLLYSTKKRCSNSDLFNWSGPEIINDLYSKINNDPSKQLDGYALCVGQLVKHEILSPAHENTFIKFVGEKIVIKDDFEITYVQWALIFENVQAVEPFEWKFGKQGVGFVPKSELSKIKTQ